MLECQMGYQKAEEFYDGDVQEIFASANMKRRLGPMSDNYRVNLAKTPVDVLADRLEIASVAVKDDSDGENKEATQVLQERIWEDNDMDLNTKDWTRNACEYGDGYVFVWPDDDEDGDDVAGLQIIWNNPKNTRMIYDAENHTVPLYAIKVWQESGGIMAGGKDGRVFRANIYYPDTIEKWITSPGGDVKDPASWVEYKDQEDEDGSSVWPIQNPYGKIPIFHLRNGTPYGRPEHKDAYGSQHALNKLIPAHMSTVDFQSFPQRYALTEDQAEGEDEDDGIDWWRDDSQSQVIADQDRSKLKAGPGELWWLKNVKAVGQFAPADSDVFTKPIPLYVHLMAQVTATPNSEFNISGTDDLSGESRKMEDAKFSKKVKDRQRRFGATWQNIYGFALEVLGYPDCDVEVTWATAGIATEQDDWTVVNAKIEAGIPPREALMDAGCTDVQLDEWGVTDETSDIVNRRKVGLIQELGMAMQGLGVGVGFEMVDATMVSQLVDSILAPIAGPAPPAALPEGVDEPPAPEVTPPTSQDLAPDATNLNAS